MAKTKSTSSPDRLPLPKRMPYVLVKVEQRHIDMSMPEKSSHCMIAEAIKELVPGASAVTVDLHTIRWSDRSKQCCYEYLTPRAGQIGLLKFDRGVPVKPFEFRLRGGRIIRSYFGARPGPTLAQRIARAEEVETAKSLAGELAGKTPSRRPKPGARKSKDPAFGRAEIIDGGTRGSAPLVVGGRRTPHFTRYGAVRKYGLRGLLPNQIELE